MEPQQPGPIQEDDHRHGEEYAHMKNIKKGMERKEGHPAPGVPSFPKKAGKGGKFTWEGPEAETEYGEEGAPIAIDKNDPNYVDEEEEEEDRKVAAGVVEVPKMASHDVSVVDVVNKHEKK